MSCRVCLCLDNSGGMTVFFSGNPNLTLRKDANKKKTQKGDGEGGKHTVLKSWGERASPFIGETYYACTKTSQTQSYMTLVSAYGKRRNSHVKMMSLCLFTKILLPIVLRPKCSLSGE